MSLLDEQVMDYAKRDMGPPPDRKIDELFASPDCQTWYGCWGGYCWAGCDHLGAAYPEWCYTAPENFQDGSYQFCFSKEDCSNCWNCTGDCTTFFNI